MHNLEVPKNILDIESKLQNIREEKESKVSNQLFEDAAKLRDKEKPSDHVPIITDLDC